jgi:UDP-N-acetylglucosamine 2-epimerase (non-hydrolysing)
MKRILVCFGTRPEYIKVKSLIDNLPNVKTCNTGQHTGLLHNIPSDYQLSIEDTTSCRLNNIVIGILSHIEVFQDIEYVLVQGDTTSAVAMALSAVHNGKRVIHLEAGLRTFDCRDPFPEELNRQMIGRIASIHLCPTRLNRQNLMNEGIRDNIFVVGNTGLDSIDPSGCTYGNTVFITLHRRKNVETIEDWFLELSSLSLSYPSISFIIAIHPNPAIRKHTHLLKNIQVVDPLSHEMTINIVKSCLCIISDSGGLQEEASFLKKKIIICRESTERPEILGTFGTLCPHPSDLRSKFEVVLRDPTIELECPYGDGRTYQRIMNVFNEILLKD